LLPLTLSFDTTFNGPYHIILLFSHSLFNFQPSHSFEYIFRHSFTATPASHHTPYDLFTLILYPLRQNRTARLHRQNALQGLHRRYYPRRFGTNCFCQYASMPFGSHQVSRSRASGYQLL